MNRRFNPTLLLLTLFGLFLFTSCGGSSTGPGNGGGGGGDKAPAAPTNFNGESGNKEIVLSWNANGENDLAGYNLYRSTSSFSDITDMSPVNGSSLLSGTDYTDTGLDNGTTYYYRLTAVDSNDNESGISTQVEITPFSDPPDHPQ